MGSDELSEIGVLNGGELAAWALAEAGVEVVFALHGGHLDSFLTGCRRFGIDLVDCRHEAAAVNAADGYARSTGRLGVAAVTAGPGLFNAVAGISNAAADSIGVMVVTSSPPLGEAETGEMQGCLDQLGVVGPITKWASRAYTARRVPDLVGLAIRHATGGVPGPVVLDIPIDVAFTPVKPERVPAFGRPEAGERPVPSAEAIAAAVRLLNAAERPALVVGDSSMSVDIADALERFVAATGFPVFSTTLSRGSLPGSHPLYGGTLSSLGGLGAIGVEPPDVVLLVGASFGLLLGGRGFAKLAGGAKVIQMHLDPAEIGRLGGVDVGVLGDLAAGLDAIRQQLAGRDVTGWAAKAVAMKRFADMLFEGAGMEDDGLHPYRAAKEIAGQIPPGSILIRDGGEAAIWIDWATTHLDLGGVLALGYQGHLGVGQGFAVGAQRAHPDRRVIQVTGDGAIGFHIQEWDTMVRHRLPVVTVVLNNAAWGMSIHGQHAVYGAEGDVISRLAPTRYDLVAEGFGAFGQHVSSVEELAPAMARALDSGRPSVINVATSAAVVNPITTSMLGDLTVTDQIVIPYYENIPLQ
ncbi:MAG: thiamine pyrophosphate-binding protein [Acidimicrobiaceae bacterium]|nr:thiamine pyrophosphate-binding protein [Acidimicrobiaceae bacterium]MCO5328767.1 thiamine pyrophosphate-binding protein [Ilumatobacteraceae bacterium]